MTDADGIAGANGGRVRHPRDPGQVARVLAEHRTFATRDDDPRPRKYVLDMFPYPSGDLHMGHAEAFAFGDIVARFWRQRGFNVLHPIGWDSFGLPAENAAIQRGANPVTWTYENIAQQRESFYRYGLSFDWTACSTRATRSTTGGTSGSS